MLNSHTVRVIKKSFLLAFFCSHLMAHEIRLFDFSDAQHISHSGPCFTLDELIKKALEFSTDSRQAIEILFQVRQSTRIKLGDLLPQINASSMAYAAATSTPMASLGSDSIFPIIGFLFPSRWFDWKSSKKLKKAEREVVSTLFADTAQSIQSIYYDVQRQHWSIKVLEFYFDQIDDLVTSLNAQDGTTARASEEDLAILENIRSDLASRKSFIDGLSSILPRLASAIGLDPHNDFGHLPVEPYQVEPLTGKIFKRHYSEFFDAAIAKSTELKNIDYLIKSATYLKKGTFWDFMDPASGKYMGIGYGHRIKVARSSIKFLKFQRSRTEMQISNAIQDTLNNYNDAVEAIPEVEKGVAKLEVIRAALEKHVKDSSVDLDINKVMRYFTIAPNMALLFINNFFIFKEAEASLNRYTWRGPVYDRVFEYKEKKIGEFLERVEKSHSFNHSFRKSMIKVRRFFGSNINGPAGP